jgi:signal transduction histidine kinase
MEHRFSCLKAQGEPTDPKVHPGNTSNDTGIGKGRSAGNTDTDRQQHKSNDSCARNPVICLLHRAAVCTLLATQLVFGYLLYVEIGEQEDSTSNSLIIGISVGIALTLMTTILFIMVVKLLNDDNSNIERILEQKRRYVRLVSHEIRTPLNTVKMVRRMLALSVL